MVINHLTAPWYTKRLEMLSEVKAAFCLYLMGKKEEAFPKLEIILSHDVYDRQYYLTGWPNAYSRFKSGFELDKMYADRDEIDAFPAGDARWKLWIAEWYYQMEFWNEAYWRYREIDRLYRKSLNRIASSYLDLILAQCEVSVGTVESAYPLFSVFEKKKEYYGTRAWERAMIWLSVAYYQRFPRGTKEWEKSQEYLMEIYRLNPKSTKGLHMLASVGLGYFVVGDYKRAQEIFEKCLKEGKGTWVERAVRSFMEKELEPREKGLIRTNQ